MTINGEPFLIGNSVYLFIGFLEAVMRRTLVAI